MEMSSDLAIKKPKRLTSVVWNHFERVRKGDACYALCVHCNKKLSGSSNSGTTHLRNHLMRCLKRLNCDVSQLLSVKRRKKDENIGLVDMSFDEGQSKDEFIKPNIVKFDQDLKRDGVASVYSSGKFDQEQSQLDLTRMIIMHGYPLAMVEHVGFQVFMKNLQPLFEVPTGSTELSCMEIYRKEKNKVWEELTRFHGRINLSVEKWSSLEREEFLCLIAHYIDEDWVLQNKILNFVTLDSSYTEDMFPDVIIKCLMDWDLDLKLFALTYDDCSIHDDIILRIKEQISHKRSVSSDRKMFDLHSASHVLHSIVEDALASMRELNQKIRQSFRYARSTQKTLEKFNEIVQQVGISSQRKLILDNPLQWNSTYTMLETALAYRGAFSLLQEQDPAYTSSLTDAEWEWTSTITGHLQLFVEIINVFSCSKFPTRNTYFAEICDIHIRLIEWCKSPDCFLSSLALKMKVKFDKYWSKCKLPLAMAAILDPRYKMKLVEYYYSQIFGSTALDQIREVSDGVKDLFNAYSVFSTMVDQSSALPGPTNDTRDRLKGFDQFIHDISQNQNVISDLDKYLEEPVFPRNCDFNILNWWKVHTPRYPILSMMARDVLGTPLSTITPEFAFRMEGRVLDRCRSSLNPDSRQALICTQNWLGVDVEDLNSSSTLPAPPQLIGSS